MLAGAVSLRATSMITGRARSVSLIVASRYSSSPSASDSRSARSARGVRSSRSIAQASAVAVVSCPAPSTVTSSSRRPSSLARGRRAHPRHRPGARGRRGLVPGPEHRHELVAQLFVAHRAAVVVTGREQQREHVVVAVRARLDLPAPQGDLLVDELVERLTGAEEARPGTPATEIAAQHRKGGYRVDPAGEGLDQALEPRQALLVVDAEDGAHDHPQGDPLRMATQRERLVDPPGRHLCQGDLADARAVALDPLALERRQGKRPLLPVWGVVEGEGGG